MIKRSSTLLSFLSALCLLTLAASSVQCKTIFVKTDGSDTADGLSWTTARKSIPSAISLSVTSDQIWVAKGSYTCASYSSFTLKNGVALYGGFSGTESDLTERPQFPRSANDPNETVLVGNGASVVVFPTSSTAGTKIDGFTIRRGSGTHGAGIVCSGYAEITNNTIKENRTTNTGAIGGGIECQSGSPTITNNIITNNSATSYGGAISCGGPAIIKNNVIVGNASYLGPAIYCNSTSPTIAGNVIADNGSDTNAGAIYCDGVSIPTITNNTIVRNLCAGVQGNSAIKVSNNIIAFNYAGIVSSSTAVLKKNCVYGNEQFNYSGGAASSTDISVDPKLVSLQYSNYHIQGDSLCIDGGDDASAVTLTSDIDGESRTLGTHVDIGADETDGKTWTITPAIIRVASNGNDANDGLSWDTPKKTVQAGINAAAATYGEVWVAAGTYLERLTLPMYVDLYGGFAGTETDRSERDWKANKTILDGTDTDQTNGSVISSGYGAAGCIDGFTICNGTAATGGGIYCAYSRVTISNNILDRNSYGSVYADFGNITISNNTITNTNPGSLPQMGAIRCSGAATISGNMITSNTGASAGAIWCCPTYTDKDYCGKLIKVSIINNVIAGNSATTGPAAIATGLAAVTVVNNTIVSNSCPTYGAITSDAGTNSFVNNIIAFNSGGMYRSSTAYPNPTISYNCVYGNRDFDYYGLTPSSSNISVDPKIASIQYGNCHIQPGSPCVDTADDVTASSITADIDGNQRKLGNHIDMGADESDGTVWTVTPNVVFVKPNGVDANNGSSWGLAKKTIQAGINAAAATGGEVWVAASTYNERITLAPYVHLYGGFSGVETVKSQRDWSKNISKIDGQQLGSVVWAQCPGFLTSTVDGFTIYNGKANRTKGANGGGVRVSFGSAPIICNNIIKTNSALETSGGGGIYCSYSCPQISKNTITGNTTGTTTTLKGGGILSEYSSITLTSNNITSNSCWMGYEAVCITSGKIVMTGNTISGNTSTSTVPACAVYISGAPSVLNNNLITDNTSGGLSVSGQFDTTITGNTIVSNSGNGVEMTLGAQTVTVNAKVSNNIVAYNSTGIKWTAGTYNPSLKLRNNCIYNPSGANYTGTTAGVGDISYDPMFIDRANKDYHLTSTSMCINAGWNSATQLGIVDMDNEPRIRTATIDIGADEYWIGAPYVKDAKSADITQRLEMARATVTAVFGDTFYIETSDRTSGILVKMTNHNVSVGSVVYITGTVTTNTDGELYVQAESVLSVDSGMIDPLGLTNKSLGGSAFGNQGGILGQTNGLNNIGLLVKSCGKVVLENPDYFLDDGSNARVKLILPAGVSIDESWQYISVTGISSCEKIDGELVRVLRVRTQEDIVKIN